MALSYKFVVSSAVLGVVHTMEFERGKAKYEKEKETKSPADFQQGTYIYLEPDNEIIGNTNLSVDEVYQTLVLKIFPLIPRGYVIDFIGRKFDNTTFTQHLVNTEGIRWDLMRKVQKPLIDPIEFSNDTGTMRFHAIFTYDPSDMNDREDIDA